MDKDIDRKSEIAYETFKNMWIKKTKERLKNQHNGRIIEPVVCLEKSQIKRLSMKEDRFKSSLIGKLMINLGFESESRKHMFEEYDIMLLMMKELNQDELTVKDFDRIDIFAFYQKYFKDKQEQLLDTIDKIYFETNNKKREKLIKEYHRQEREFVPDSSI